MFPFWAMTAKLAAVANSEFSMGISLPILLEPFNSTWSQGLYLKGGITAMSVESSRNKMKVDFFFFSGWLVDVISLSSRNFLMQKYHFAWHYLCKYHLTWCSCLMSRHLCFNHLHITWYTSVRFLGKQQNIKIILKNILLLKYRPQWCQYFFSLG